MNAALLPVRALASAKGRLGASLSPGARERLTLAMLADMIEALSDSHAIARIFVVSADAAVLAAAVELGAEPFPEGDGCRGLNAAVRDSARRLATAGAKRLLVIPGDVPLIDRHEIDELMAIDPRLHPVVAVPSRSGTGTNALLLSPPGVIDPRFEGESLVAHRDACIERGLRLHEMALTSFGLDVDTAEDLEYLRLHGAHRRSGRVVGKLEYAAA